MKTLIILIAMISIYTNTAKSQSHKSCCEDEQTSASEKMASLGDDKNFKDAHPVPLDFKLTDGLGSIITFNTSDGKTGNGYVIKPVIPTNKWILVFHEWYGLNDYIKKESDYWAEKLGDVNVLAVDLYDGKVASNSDEASKYVKEVESKRAFTIIQGAIDYAGDGAVFGTIGWCFGGMWSLQAAIVLEGKCKACVMYYGMPEEDKDRLSKLSTPVLGIFGKKDGFITPEVVAKFEDNMKSLNKTITVKSYDAVHGFANPSNPKHDPDATKEAKEITYNFYKDNLK